MDTTDRQRPLDVAIIGCGSRGRTYARLMAEFPGSYRLVAAAEPDAGRLDLVAAHAPPGLRTFADAGALLAGEKLADLAIVATQDDQHAAQTLAAISRGYDVLVEKPVATNLADIERIDRHAREHGRKVLTCFVLRYTPFYRAVKAVVDSGRLGQIISLRAFEGVDPWHQAHSFVRGHWSRTSASTPMIVAKCCHDMDILAWLVDSPARAISSYGRLSYFTAANAPAGATPRCTDPCPHCGSCPYDAHRYLTDKRASWLPMVHPTGADQDDEQLTRWLQSSPWGRCVFRCDNDAVDHQTVNIDFANGVTATFTMTAFDDGRRIEIYGTEAALSGHPASYRDAREELVLTRHHHPGREVIEIPAATGGHGGGDRGLVEALFHQITGNGESGLLGNALRGHQIAFAAEAARQAHCP